MLEVRDLHVRYLNRSRPAVDGLSLRVGLGEFVLLMGGSASGKSTAMQAVCGFIPEIIQAEVRGTVSIGGRVYDDATEASAVVSMVQQDPETQFCTETVEDEVAFGPENFNTPPGEIRRVVDESLTSVRGTHLLERRLSTLSGGEKQKVAIASMLAMRPKLLILDEPTSNLDPRAVTEVVSVIDGLRRRMEMSIIVVEHRPEGFMDIASRAITMGSGRLVEDRRRGEAGFEEMVSPPSDVSAGGVARRGGPALVDVKHLDFSIGDARILKDITFTVDEGAVVALMGENGSGKTTLLKHIAGLIPPQSGEIMVSGHFAGKKAKAEPWSIGRDVGFVFQNPNHQIFERTVEREIRFAADNYRADTEEAAVAVEEFEQSEGVRRFVHPHCLSFGQKRRVNIRSASSHGPKLLLLDEPFAGQDSRNASSIRDMLAGLHSHGKTIIVVTHDPRFAKAFCTDVLFLKGGRMVMSGDMSGVSEDMWKTLFEVSGG